MYRKTSCANLPNFTMDVVPLLALIIFMVNLRITCNSAVYVEVLSEPINFPLSFNPSKEMGDCTRQRKSGNQTHNSTILACTAETHKILNYFMINYAKANLLGSLNFMSLL